LFIYLVSRSRIVVDAKNDQSCDVNYNFYSELKRDKCHQNKCLKFDIWIDAH